MAEPIDTEQIDQELLPFLSPTARPDLRCVAMQCFLGLTGSEDGRNFLDKDKYLTAVVNLFDDPQDSIAKDAFLALVNLTTEDKISHHLLYLKDHPHFILHMLLYVINEHSPHADIACSALCNLTRSEICARAVVQVMMKETEQVGFERVIFVFCQNGYNKKGNNLNYLGPFLSNLTQIRDARHCIMDKKLCVIQRLLPFVDYDDSKIRRGGIVAAIHNCCFETSYHEWLLSDDVDILPRLVLPLAGPEEFDDDDNERLPPDLQYLEPDKKREEDPDIRKMLIESVTQLCATQPCRLLVKEKNIYVILRELFNWEKDPSVNLATENLIQLLIGDEPEKGMENLHELEIPDDVGEKLEKSRLEAEKEVQEEMAKMAIEEKKEDTAEK